MEKSVSNFPYTNILSKIELKFSYNAHSIRSYFWKKKTEWNKIGISSQLNYRKSMSIYSPMLFRLVSWIKEAQIRFTLPSLANEFAITEEQKLNNLKLSLLPFSPSSTSSACFYVYDLIDTIIGMSSIHHGWIEAKPHMCADLMCHLVKSEIIFSKRTNKKSHTPSWSVNWLFFFI